MKSARDLDYRLHHLCIYDDKPRDSMWPYLRWHHGITNYFSGAVFHVTGEGHSDYTFLGCGGRAYQVQIEAPPFQFEYERNWWRDHQRGYNHICWITSDARASMEQLLANGATEVMPFEEFPTYDGFVVHDPEGRWIEIMEYTDDTFRVQEFTHAPAIPELSGPSSVTWLGISLRYMTPSHVSPGATLSRMTRLNQRSVPLSSTTQSRRIRWHDLAGLVSPFGRWFGVTPPVRAPHHSRRRVGEECEHEA